MPAPYVFRKHNGRTHAHRLVAHLGAARIPLFLFRHVYLALWERNELRGRQLVHLRRHTFYREGRLAGDLAMAPGLLVPFVGGVLIDRFDRRYLGVILDFVRGVAVLGTAYIAWHGHLQL